MHTFNRQTHRFKQVLRRAMQPWAQHSLRQHTAFAKQILQQLAEEQLFGRQSIPHVVSAVQTRSAVVVLRLGEADTRQTRWVLKLPLTHAATQSTMAHCQALLALRQQAKLAAFCIHTPRPIKWGSFSNRFYSIETALAGSNAADLMRHHIEPATLLPAAAGLIQQLHQHTLQRHVVNESRFARMAGVDLANLQLLSTHWPFTTMLRRQVSALEMILRDQLLGRTLPFSWAHGDFWPGNLLIQPDSASISGIIDWDRAGDDQAPQQDLLHLLAYTHKLHQHCELGETIVGYLLPAMFNPNEHALWHSIREQLQLPSDVEFWRASVLLYWLRFAVTNLMRYPALQHDQRWLRKNVLLVLKQGVSCES